MPERNIMAEHHSESLYMTIFYYLLALTILEIIAALSRWFHICMRHPIVRRTVGG